jgi:hypothetical protein
MANVSGKLLFDRNRTANPASLAGIANVEIVLLNIMTEEVRVDLTAADGSFAFDNAADGDYKIIEAYGFSGGTPVAETPPIGFAPNPPAEATDLDCVTPNTLLITVSGSDITDLFILNGPVTYTMIDIHADIIPGNLIEAADEGTFGFFASGTPANTSPTVPPIEPYPGLVPDFEYVLSSSTESIPDDGQYTIMNIMNDNFNNFAYTPGGTWWRIADHSSGNETGLFMLVNGFQINSVFFVTEVPVEVNTEYLFSSWILNIYKFPGFLLPALGVKITGNNTGLIFEESLGAEIPTRTVVPEWKQVGAVFNSGDNTSISIEFVSLGEAGFGNDYAVDDVSLNRLRPPVPPSDRCQAFTDIVQSAALQEAAIAHLLNAEGEKIQQIVAMLDNGEATAEQVTAVNDSATQLVEALNVLEAVIRSKLRLIADGFEECGE